MRNEKIVVAIAVEIPCCQAHGAAVLLDPRTLASVHEGPVVVQVELVLRNVIGHVEIGPAIAIEVVPEGAQAPALRIGNAKFLGEFGIAGDATEMALPFLLFRNSKFRSGS